MSEELKEHIQNCPIGYVRMLNEPSKLIQARNSTPDNFIDWFEELERLAGIEE